MFRASGNRILVDISENVPGFTKGGLKLPENTKIEPIGTGKVISVGPGVMTAHGWDAPMVTVGDRIIFERARTIPIDKPNFIVALWAGDVLGVERETELSRPTLNGRLVEASN